MRENGRFKFNNSIDSIGININSIDNNSNQISNNLDSNNNNLKIQVRSQRRY